MAVKLPILMDKFPRDLRPVLIRGVVGRAMLRISPRNSGKNCPAEPHHSFGWAAKKKEKITKTKKKQKKKTEKRERKERRQERVGKTCGAAPQVGGRLDWGQLRRRFFTSGAPRESDKLMIQGACGDVSAKRQPPHLGWATRAG